MLGEKGGTAGRFGDKGLWQESRKGRGAAN